MKTSVIRRRVADFLKQHAPFDVLPEEDLLELAGTGRVTFHESEEYLIRRGQPWNALIRVIQQGRVEVVDERPEGDRLRDVLGEGDILELGRFLGIDSSLHAARTASDVILYSIDAGAFEGLVNQHPRMARYLATHLTERYEQDDQESLPKSVWLEAEEPTMELLRRRLRTCHRGASIREAASRMAQSPSGALAVVDAEGRALGLITDREIRDCVAHGSLDGPCETIMNARIEASRAGLGTLTYLLQMMRSRSYHLFITADGTAAGPLLGVMTNSDLALACGRNPVLLLHEMLRAGDILELAQLLRYRDALVAESLTGPESVERCAPIAAALDAAFAESVIRLAGESVAAAGHAAPDLACCWLLFGRSGRAENLAPVCPSIGVVFADPPEEGRAAAAEYFSAVLSAIEQHLDSFGLQTTGDVPAATRRCISLSGWKQYYGELIRDPLGAEIYPVRSMFDFCPVAGDRELARQLEHFLAAELEQAEIFIPVLANDTLANLPPMTFFRGLVVELNGAEGNTLDIQRYALQPVEDAARVFAIAGRPVSVTNTLDRLRNATGGAGGEIVFRDAREAFLVAALHRARAGFRNRGNTVIDPSKLSKYEQRLLKTAFQSIRRLLEFTSSTFIGATEL
jgi:CBS domain-containing protein